MFSAFYFIQEKARGYITLSTKGGMMERLVEWLNTWITIPEKNNDKATKPMLLAYNKPGNITTWS